MPKTKDELFDDRNLLIKPGDAIEPLSLAWRLGCWASALLVVLSWAGLSAVMVAGLTPWAAWPFVALPATLWTLFIILPAFWKMRKGMVKLLDSIVQTAEAYLSRAGWVVDLNSDGVIGHIQPVSQATTDVRPIIFKGRGLIEEHRESPRALPAPVQDGAMADATINGVGGADGLPLAENEPPERVKIWHLPNQAKVHEEVLQDFVDGIFTAGLSRGYWVGGGHMEREQYEGSIQLLELSSIISGRKKGHAGKLNVRNAGQVRRVLDLPPRS
ncbi:MAG: hypothetical protein ACYTEQ_19165 [Planctomycetota bacterium]|jgi:hypothetical protein